MNCRFRAKLDRHISIPSGATVSVPCVVTPANRGEFGLEFHLYLDDNGLRTLTATVRGTARAAPPE